MPILFPLIYRSGCLIHNLFNAIPDTNHNAKLLTLLNLTVTVRVTLTLLTLLTLILDTVVNKAPTSVG